MYVLGQMVKAVKSGGEVLDLQVIRPNPVVEVGGSAVCEIDGEPLFITADAATAAIDALVGNGALIELAIDDHDVREHHDATEPTSSPHTRPSGGNSRTTRFRPCVPLRESCAVRERCRLRRLQVR